jgi:hypothetical protein
MFKIKGKCSKFGGPGDTGVSPSEGLAVYPDLKAALACGIEDLFLNFQPQGTTGTARRLNPKAMYCAMRWAYTPIMRGAKKPKLGTCLPVTTGMMFLRNKPIVVKANGKRVSCWAVDWGPNENTGRIIDLSPGALEALGVQTDDEVEVVIDAV